MTPSQRQALIAACPATAEVFAELDEANAQIDAADECGGNLMSHCQAYRARIEDLEAGLLPFADFADCHPDINGFRGSVPIRMWHDFQRAAELLKGKP